MWAGGAPASAITSTSEGPAGMSMATMASLFCSSILAAVTYWLPGPRILSTCTGHLGAVDGISRHVLAAVIEGEDAHVQECVHVWVHQCGCACVCEKEGDRER